MSNPLNFQFDDFFGGLEDQISDAQFDLEDDFLQGAPTFMDIDTPNVSFAQDFAGLLETDDFGNVMTNTAIKFVPDDERKNFEFDDRSIAEMVQEGIFGEEGFLRDLGLGSGAIKDVAAFFKGAQRGGKKQQQGQGQGRGRIGPGLTTSTPRTSAAGRTSRARQATSGERAVQSAISQSNRAQSAARAIANQMARAGTVTTTNDLADMISGATSPKGTKQALPGTRLRQLAIPRTA